jgi:site-specific DNA recombinase
MIRAAIYPRVSTQEQVDGYSINQQIERMTAYCEAMGWTICGTYTDPGRSGGNMDRPGLQSLIADVKKRKIDKVVVWRLDRLSRSQFDTLYLIEKVFLPNGTDFVSMSESFDTSTSMGRATIGLLAVFAQLEKETIRERLMMGKEAKIRDGYWIGAVAPMGYDYTDGKLVVNEDEAVIIRELFTLCNSGTPLHDIETRFSGCGYTLRGRPLRLWSIKYMLDNKIYAGYLRSRNGWVKGAHDPIVTEEVWQQAHDRLEANKTRFAEYGVQTNGDRHTTLLGGMLWCKQCGARYGKRLQGHGDYRRYCYCCYSRMRVMRHMVRDENCKNKIYRVEDLDRIVCDEILKLGIDDITPQNNEYIDDKNKIKAQIARIDEQISRFLDLYGLGSLSVEQLDNKVTSLEERRTALSSQLDDGSGKSSEIEVRDAIINFRSVLETGDRKNIRMLIDTLINRIIIDGEDISIEWRF